MTTLIFHEIDIRWWRWLVALLFLLTSCTLDLPRPETPIPVTPGPTPTVSPYPWTDENAVVRGICFEAANDAAEQVFVVRNPEQHIRFYELADNSLLCRHPVTRYPFDFSDGRILAGLWSRGHGCTARHDVLDVQRDDTDRRLTIRLRFVTEGDCDYELVRPFWVGLDGMAGYTIEIHVERANPFP